MKEQISTNTLYNIINREGIHVIYGYTPICATCKLAENFLDIASEVVDIEATKIDLNYHEPFIKEFEVRSVPALLIFKEGTLEETVYAFESVTKIVETLQAHMNA